MSKIISVGTALPPFKHAQRDILQFMLEVYQVPVQDKRKVTLLYERSGIDTRYSVIPDYSLDIDHRIFYPPTKNLEPFPSLEKRMEWYHRHATSLSVQAIENCIAAKIGKAEITHLITVSCTGLAAPGLDISILQEMQLPSNTHRTSVNFMGCYAALHALKMADAICLANNNARVIIVCTELCTLHFQKEYEMDNIAASLLFSDGAAAALITGKNFPEKGLAIQHFYSEVALNGKTDMAWHLSGKGFLMTLSAYIPQLIKEGIEPLLKNALNALNLTKEMISHWAIHPGGKKILETIQEELLLGEEDLAPAFYVLRKYGNMSSPTILFVLKEIMRQLHWNQDEKIFAAAFGPGLTMETVILQA